jgi:hypothetical protein
MGHAGRNFKARVAPIPSFRQTVTELCGNIYPLCDGETPLISHCLRRINILAERGIQVGDW